MTKKTNSLLFRLGINSLWQMKMSNFLQVFDFFRLEKMLKSELIKHKWNILSIQWNKISIFIQLYDNFTLSKAFKQNIFRYYKKTKNIKKLSEKFNLNHIFVIDILKKIRKSSINYYCKYFKIWNILLFNLFLKKKKLQNLMKIISYLKKFNWTQIIWILTSFFTLKKFNFCSSNFLYNKNSFIKQNFQKINGFIYFKILSIFFENILFNLTKKYINIYFNNIWHNCGWVFKDFSKNEFVIRLLFLSCIYNNTQMFSEYVAIQLQGTKHHKKFLRQTILSIETFWKFRKISLQGIQLRITGKLDGRMRKSKYHYSVGKVQLQKLETFLNYTMSISYTKFGIISTKFWLLHDNQQI